MTQVRSRLLKAGDWPAPGLMFHVAYRAPRTLRQCFEVSKCRDTFERFGTKLIPLLDKISIEVNHPQVVDIYKIDSLQ